MKADVLAVFSRFVLAQCQRGKTSARVSRKHLERFIKTYLNHPGLKQMFVEVKTSAVGLEKVLNRALIQLLFPLSSDIWASTVGRS